MTDQSPEDAFIARAVQIFCIFFGFLAALGLVIGAVVGLFTWMLFF